MQQPNCEHPFCTNVADWTLSNPESRAIPPNLCAFHWNNLKTTLPAWANAYQPIQRSGDESRPPSRAGA